MEEERAFNMSLLEELRKELLDKIVEKDQNDQLFNTKFTNFEKKIVKTFLS